MMAPMVKAWKMSAMRVGHSRLTSDKFLMSPSAVFLLGIVPGPEVPVCDGGHKQAECARRGFFVATITV